MTTYNAKDLIEQAAMMADLQNSDFISWKENMVFLDNAWVDLYQQIINHGDKTFIKSFTFSGDRVELPDDFYQLNYVCYSAGLNRIPINRKAKTSTGNGPFYDLVGNELVIYNKINSMQNVEVDYFPTRDSITFAADDKKFDEAIDNIIDVCEQSVLYSDSGVYTVRNMATGDEMTVGTSFMLTKNGVFNGNTPAFKSNNRVYTYSYNSNTLTIYKGTTTVYKVIDNVTVLPNFPAKKINAMTDYGFYWVDNGVLKFWSFDTKLTTDFADSVINDKVYAFDNSVYYETNEGIYCNYELVISSRDYDTYNGVMKVDLKTGYGILVDGDILKSSFANTELDYPNNFYFNYLAYKLAVYYKIKQNQDVSSLAALAMDALKTFYDTLPKDENEYVRISNVYAR